MKESVKQVVDLRLSGMTYSQIAERTGLSRGTISYTCNKYIPDNSDRSHRAYLAWIGTGGSTKALAAAYTAAKKHYQKSRLEATELWSKKIEIIDPRRVYYLAGLYDGEGNHSGTEFSLSNSEKSIILFAIAILKEIGCDLTLSLNIHKSHDREACVAFWGLTFSRVVQLDGRPQKKTEANRFRENYGTVHIRVRKPLGLREAIRSYSFSHAE